ncbi:MAG: hypothetical protein V1859_10200 [archaeon]
MLKRYLEIISLIGIIFTGSIIQISYTKIQENDNKILLLLMNISINRNKREHFELNHIDMEIARLALPLGFKVKIPDNYYNYSNQYKEIVDLEEAFRNNKIDENQYLMSKSEFYQTKSNYFNYQIELEQTKLNKLFLDKPKIIGFDVQKIIFCSYIVFYVSIAILVSFNLKKLKRKTTYQKK